MEGPSIPSENEPHVLIFPLPVHGHLNSMLKLAELLLIAGLHVTFLISDVYHNRLLLHGKIQSRFSQYTKINLEIISDGIPTDHARSDDHLMKNLDAFIETMEPKLRELLISYTRGFRNLPPVTCLIADGIFGFAIDVAKDIGVMCVVFETISACCFWTFFRLPALIHSGEVPFDDEEMDELVTSIPGMETFLRRRDLPSFYRVKQLPNPLLDFISSKSVFYAKADAHMINTFEELEGPVLSQIRARCPNVYTIGPLHAHLKSKLQSNIYSSSSSISLWEEDRSCLAWLDSQPLKSVIYVSFGSLTILTRDQFMEIWHGLMSSNRPFLWVIRPDLIVGENGEHEIMAEVIKGSKDRGYMVEWAPQEEVLAHSAIGGFFTHSGWNSSVESIVAGVPMICWPYFADQQVNSRFVSEVWKLGLDMKDVCDRVVVEKMVNDLMEVRRDDFLDMANRMAEAARKCVSQGGSSYCSFDRLIADIRSISS